MTTAPTGIQSHYAASPMITDPTGYLGRRSAVCLNGQLTSRRDQKGVQWLDRPGAVARYSVRRYSVGTSLK